jgi:CubicO group peptidase (beta-lactamase class C family)
MLSRFGAWLLLATLVACASTGSGARLQTSGLPAAAPEEVGLSASQLARIGPAMQELIDEGRTAGVMTLVARRGRVVHWDARGWRVLGEDPLEPDDIFRIYSMTKPVTSVAVMLLVEEGRLSLDTELAEVLPAFADVQVFEAGQRRPAARGITIRDLLTHTSGLGYGDIGRTPVDSLYREARLGVWGTAGDLEETVDAIASLPLIFDPGTRWNYSLAVDVLGRVIEVVSGRTLAEFFEERIFDRLGMEDTGFHVPAEKLDRFAAVYGPGPDGLRMIDSPVDGQHTRPAQWLSGGGGLTSTASDYLRFTQMLLNEGELDGARVLRPETVRLMRRNHLPDDLMPISIGGQGEGFGLGFAVSMSENAGTYRWLGIAGTNFWIDPNEELIVFAWNQLQPQGGAPISSVVSEIVYGALLEEDQTSSRPPIFQPGAPGQSSRALTQADVASLDGPEHTEADVRFMQGMIPHHAQALRMTALARARGESDVVRGMALRMDISQVDEIGLMQRWLSERGAPAPEVGPAVTLPMMPGMLTAEQMARLSSATGEDFDRLFLELMIQHHGGALTMVERLFSSPGGGQETEIFQFASEVEADQTIEIERMQSVLQEMFAK